MVIRRNAFIQLFNNPEETINNLFYNVMAIVDIFLITYVTHCSNPYAEYPPFPLHSLTSSKHFHYLSSLCLNWTMYIAFICNSHSLIVGGSKLEMSTFWFFKILAFVTIVFIKSKNVWNVTLHIMKFYGIE